MSAFGDLLKAGNYLVAEFAQQAVVSAIENLYDDPVGWIGGPAELHLLSQEVYNLKKIAEDLEIKWEDVSSTRSHFEIKRLEDFLKGT